MFDSPSRRENLRSAPMHASALVIAITSGTAASQGQELTILDLNESGAPTSETGTFTPRHPEFNGQVFFTASHDDGDELFVTNGTTAGTMSAGDLNLGWESSFPVQFTVVGSRVFFAATESSIGNEIWWTDAPGSNHAIDVLTGPDGALPRNLTAFDGDLYFTARENADDTDLGANRALFRVDSSTLIATQVGAGAFNIPILPSTPFAFTTNSTQIYFVADPADGGDREIWASDGTAVGTAAATFLACPAYTELTELNDEIYFICDSASDQLRRMDGSVGSGAALVREFTDGSARRLTPSAGLLYFTVDAGGNRRLFTHDPVAMTTQVLPGLAATALPDDLVAFAGGILFSADNGSGRELYWTDNTTLEEFDLRPGPEGSSPDQIHADATQAYFTADVGAAGRELWVTDGTQVGTDIVTDLVAGAGSPQLFSFGPSTSFGRIFTTRQPNGIWVTDGTEAGTLSIELPDSFQVFTLDITAVPGGAYFYGPEWSPRLQFTDGTVEGTVDLGPPDLTFVENPIPVPGGRVVFLGNDGASKNFGAGPSPGSIEELDPALQLFFAPTIDFEGRLFLCGDEEVYGNELWTTDGTAAGTGLFLDINPAGDAFPCSSGFTKLGEHLYFNADDGTGNALWRTDGTVEGTEKVLNFAATGMEVYDGSIYFLHTDGATGTELWRSDGTDPGTALFADLLLGPDSSSPSRLTVGGGLLWFWAETGNSHEELWRSDGTIPGTFATYEVDSSVLPSLVGGASGGLVLRDGDVVLVSEGTVGAPQVVTGVNLSEFEPWAGHLYFAAADALGSQLWRTDGTVSGTGIVPLDASSGGPSPISLGAHEGRLYFNAYNPSTKREIHWLDYRFFFDGFERGDTESWSATTP